MLAIRKLGFHLPLHLIDLCAEIGADLITGIGVTRRGHSGGETQERQGGEKGPWILHTRCLLDLTLLSDRCEVIEALVL